MSSAEVPVRDAATVVLLRDGTSGLEVWLLTRATQMVFAAGMAVFPGGRVDDDDAALPFGSGVDEAAARFGCSPEQARSVLGAAVRETFEETGVLLSLPPADLSSWRAAVEAGELAFGTLLSDNNLTIDGAAVHPWARWVTPAGEVRRYDTRFFVAAMPADAVATDVTTEASSARWFGVGEALEQAQRGELGLLPPTISMLTSLAGYSSVAQAVASAAERTLDPVRPTVIRDESGGFRIVLADGQTFPLPKALFGANDAS